MTLLINTSRPDSIDTGDVQMDKRILHVISRRRELIAEGQEMERKLCEINHELMERRFDEMERRAFAGE